MVLKLTNFLYSFPDNFFCICFRLPVVELMSVETKPLYALNYDWKLNLENSTITFSILTVLFELDSNIAFGGRSVYGSWIMARGIGSKGSRERGKAPPLVLR
jgi:hypothetical protein